MKVIAKYWVNHNGTWHRPGEEYEVGAPEPTGAPLQPPATLEPAQEEAQPVKRTRKRKTEE